MKLRFVSKYAKFENWQEGYNAVKSAIGETGESTKMEFKSKMNSGNSGNESVASKFSQGGTNFNFASDPVPGAQMPDIMPDGGGDAVPF